MSMLGSPRHHPQGKDGFGGLCRATTGPQGQGLCGCPAAGLLGDSIPGWQSRSGSREPKSLLTGVASMGQPPGWAVMLRTPHSPAHIPAAPPRRGASQFTPADLPKEDSRPLGATGETKSSAWATSPRSTGQGSPWHRALLGQGHGVPGAAQRDGQSPGAL